MKVKIGDTIYDAEDQMVMLILTEEDKRLISTMHPDQMKFCCAPDGTTPAEMLEFMQTD